jgi:hypothetical protein
VCATADAPSYMRVEIALTAGPYDAVFLLDQNAGQAPSTFRGLSIAGSNAIELRPAGAHRVYCNHLGVDGPGQDLMNFPNHGAGVLLQYWAQGVWIGTDGDGVDDAGERNVFGGWGLNVNVNANSENVIAGNYFGLAADGVTLLECNRGVYMRQSSYGNRVGTDFDGVSDELERNVVARCSIGIDLSENSGGAPNDIAGNWIGVDATGAPAANQIGIALRYDGVDRIAYNRIEANGIGIAIDGGQPAQLAPDSIGNCFADNGTGFSHGGTAAIAFESNWWGAADGPSGLGPGTGDSVVVTGAGSVDFAPWETEACPAPEAASLGAAIAALTSLASLARAKRRSALRDLRVRARSARS